MNGKQTTYAYNDPLDRLTGMQLPNSGYTYYSYPNSTTVVTQRDQSKSGDAALKSQVLYDGLGRAFESDTFESTSQYIATTTAYDGLGRVLTKTNPSRPGDGLNYVTTYAYDPLGRTTAVTTPDRAVARQAIRETRPPQPIRPESKSNTRMTRLAALSTSSKILLA